MTKTVKVHLLSTPDGVLWLIRKKLEYIPNANVINGIGYHVYLTEHTAIKEHDYFISKEFGVIRAEGKLHEVYRTKRDKIIATTNKAINLQGVLEAKGNSINTGTNTSSFTVVPAIPQSFIDAYIKAYNEYNPINEVELEMQENYDINYYTPAGGVECAKRIDYPDTVKLTPQGEVIYSFKEEKTYTRQQLKSAILTFCAFKKPMSMEKFEKLFDKNFPQ